MRQRSVCQLAFNRMVKTKCLAVTSAQMLLLAFTGCVFSHLVPRLETLYLFPVSGWCPIDLATRFAKALSPLPAFCKQCSMPTLALFVALRSFVPVWFFNCCQLVSTPRFLVVLASAFRQPWILRSGCCPIDFAAWFAYASFISDTNCFSSLLPHSVLTPYEAYVRLSSSCVAKDPDSLGLTCLHRSFASNPFLLLLHSPLTPHLLCSHNPFFHVAQVRLSTSCLFKDPDGLGLACPSSSLALSPLFSITCLAKGLSLLPAPSIQYLLPPLRFLATLEDCQLGASVAALWILLLGSSLALLPFFG